MRLLELFLPQVSRRRITDLAAEIARRSQPAVMAVVGDRVRQMSIAEARGFIRARTRTAVETEVARLLSTRPAVNVAERARLLEASLERVTVWLIAASMATAPAYRELRRAA